MKRAILIILLAGCAQAQSVEPDDSITLSAAEQALVTHIIEEQAATIVQLRKTLERVHVATGCI